MNVLKNVLMFRLLNMFKSMHMFRSVLWSNQVISSDQSICSDHVIYAYGIVGPVGLSPSAESKQSNKFYSLDMRAILKSKLLLSLYQDSQASGWVFVV